MNYWQTQIAWARASQISPDWEPALDALKQRTLHLRAQGHACEGLEDTVSTRRWIDASRMTFAEIGLQVSELHSSKNYDETFRVTASRAILKGMQPAAWPLAQQLWTRLVADCMFGSGDVVAEGMRGESDRCVTCDFALNSFGKVDLRTWCAIGLHFELASKWPGETLEEAASFLSKLKTRYGACLDAPLRWPDENKVLDELGILDLDVGDLADFSPTFAELVLHQAPHLNEAALSAIPAYRALSAFWDRFLGRSWLSQSTWLIGQVTRDMLNDPDTICRPWDYDKQAHELTQRLAQAKKQARLPAGAAPTRAALPGVPPSWPDEADEARCLFWGPASVSYGWLMFQHDAEQHANFDAFNGQQNGLIGALEPGVLTLNTALHTGEVHLSAWQADVEPAMPHEAWQEVVEVSLVVPAGAELHVENLDAEFWEALDLVPGIYRVRVAAGRYGLATEGEDRDAYGDPVERYALMFWPDTEWRPDAVLRQHHPALIAQHRRAQAGGF